jgi:hypothetical protein
MGIIRQSKLKLHGLSWESAMALADEVAIAINAAVVATPAMSRSASAHVLSRGVALT